MSCIASYVAQGSRRFAWLIGLMLKLTPLENAETVALSGILSRRCECGGEGAHSVTYW